MPPKRRAATRPAAKLVDPLGAELLSNINQARKANAELNNAGENDLEEATDKAAVAQYAVVTKATEYASRQALYQPQQTPSNYDEQMILLSLLGLVHKERENKDARNAASIQLMQVAAGAYTDIATKNFGPQLTKPWAPLAKFDEDGQKRRMERPIELWKSENEPTDTSFTPYVEERLVIHKYLQPNGDYHYINSRTGQRVQDEQGTPREAIERDVVGSKAEDGVKNKDEEDDEDDESNEDEDREEENDTDQDSNQSAPQATETANNMDMESDMDMDTPIASRN